MGVWLFQEVYQECLNTNQPFYLEAPHKTICTSCNDGPCTIITSKTENLLQTYSSSIPEKHDQIDGETFVPDVLLSNKCGKKMYIEVVVSHEASEKKIDSGIPIIEIDISCEEDLDLFFNKKLSYHDHRIRIINLENEIHPRDHSKECIKLANKLRKKEHKEKIRTDTIDRNDKIKAFIEEIYTNAIRDDMPFNIGIKRPIECHACDGGPCKKGEINEKIDLTKWFPIITLEGQTSLGKKLSIQNQNGRNLYIEINSGNLTGKKTTYNQDETIEIICDNTDFFSYNLEQPGRWGIGHRFHNLFPKAEIQNDTTTCNLMVEIFTVKESGRSSIHKTTYFEYTREKHHHYYSNIIKGTNLNDYAKIIKEVETAFTAGASIKSCYLCRYHAGAHTVAKNAQEGVFCRFLRKTCGHNKAAKCEYYRPDNKVLGTERYPHGTR